MPDWDPEANDLDDPLLVTPGQVLRVPRLEGGR